MAKRLSEETCIEALEWARWGVQGWGWSLHKEPTCPHCRNSKREPTVVRKKRTPSLYQCNNPACRLQFNVLSKTPLARSRGIKKWFRAYRYRGTLEKDWKAALLNSKREAVRMKQGFEVLQKARSLQKLKSLFDDFQENGRLWLENS